jgi:eukaryotic-like serine/threonine-protein kinase
MLGPSRFLREIKLAARLQYPHILPVYDSGESAGRLWFTMPCVEGESLRDRARPCG